MATNSKDKFKGLVHPVIISLILSIFFVSSYPILKDQIITSEVGAKYYLKDSILGNTLGHMTQYLIQTRFDESIPKDDIRFEEVDNLKYFIHDRESNRAITNIEDTSLSQFKSLMSNSQFYTKINFTKNQYTLTGSVNGEPFVSTYVSDYISPTLDYYTYDVYYFVPSTLSDTQDFITRNIYAFRIIPSIYLLLIVSAIGLMILILINILIPYEIQNTFRISQRFNNLFVELKLLLLAIPALLLSFFSTGIADDSSSIFYIKKLILDTQLPYYIIGIFFAFITCLFGTLMMVYIKSISRIGFKEGLIKRVGLFSLIHRMYHHTKKLLSPLLKFNMNHHLDRKIIILVSLNTLITMFIGLAWADHAPARGTILAIAYNIFIFYILSRQLEKLKKLYAFSKQLSQGDFHAQLEENIGILQPIANHLNVINESLKIAVEQEVQSQNMKSELISNVSHDLKTPLTSIITYVDFLKEKDLPPDKQAEYIDILDRKSKRLKILIEDLFEASKAASGNIELHSENVDLVALLKQTLGELEEKISISNLQLRPTFPDSKILCYLDGRRTYRIFENLMSNILKYAQPNSRVYIDIATTEDLATVTFKNISAYEMNFDASQITERFSRGDTSRHTEGSGLGLSIAKNLTELQKGTLTIHIDGDLFKVVLTFPLLSIK